MCSDSSETADKNLIVIAEDFPQNMLQAVSVAKRLGYQVEEAVNGRAAYEKSLDLRPNLILMDIMMPNMDGLTSIKMLKANPTTRDIPIIILTSLGAEGDCEKCLRAGANSFIEKPLKLDELKATIANVTLKKGAN